MTQLSFDDIRPNPRLIFGDLKPEIVTAFIDYHKQNPEVYEQFKRFAFEVRAAGRSYFGSKAIMERVRYESMVRGNGDFKVNNNFSSCYARLLAFDHPTFNDFFEFRHSHAVNHDVETGEK